MKRTTLGRAKNNGMDVPGLRDAEDVPGLRAVSRDSTEEEEEEKGHKNRGRRAPCRKGMTEAEGGEEWGQKSMVSGLCDKWVSCDHKKAEEVGGEEEERRRHGVGVQGHRKN